MKRVVVTGATSMIGLAVIDDLLKTEVEKIYAVIRGNSNNKDRLPDDERVVCIDCPIDCYKSLADIINDSCDAFYHIAWNGIGANRDDSIIEQSKNVLYVIEALHAAKALNCKKFIAAGSQAEYGRCDSEKISPDTPAKPETPYGIAKYAAGRMALLEAERIGMDCFWVRIFSVYGKNDKASTMISYAVRSMLNGEKTSFTPSEQKWDYLYSDDAGKALVMIGENSTGQKIYCLGSGQKRFLYEYINEIRDLIDPNIIPGIGDRPYPRNCTMNICADIGSLTADTGWVPSTSFKDGIQQVINHYRGMTQNDVCRKTGELNGRSYGEATDIQHKRKCIVCGSELMDEPLLKCANMPAAAQHMPDKDDLNHEHGIDLDLYQCSACGLVQFDCNPVDYYRDVIRSGGFNTTMAELRRKEYKRFIDTCGLEGKKIIEVGCGQGEFLQVLTEFPVKAYGIEHSKELVEKGQAKGLEIWKGFTETPGTVIKGAPYDAFLSFNFLEHQPRPNDMMQCIYNNLNDGGYGLITVPSFEYILENDSFYELLRDHIANYTEDSLRFLMEKNGFQVLHSRRINRDTIEFIVQKRRRADVSGLILNFETLSNQMQEYVTSRVQEKKKIAVWGASHQGFTAISTTGVQNGISYIIDSAPFKQGKYAPASHLPIVSPEHFFEEPVDCILIIAPGYTEEIAKSIRAKFGEAVEIAALKAEKVEAYTYE